VFFNRESVADAFFVSMHMNDSAEHLTCPKCGKPYVYTESWGKAGILVVHGYDTEAGVRHKIACHVSGRMLANADLSDSVGNWRRGKFATDSTPGPYEGYTRGDDWNGWATPVFEKVEAEHIARDFAALESRWGEFVGRYDEERDAFIFIDPGADGEEVYGAEAIIVDGLKRKVYAVGIYYWTWMEVVDSRANQELG